MPERYEHRAVIRTPKGDADGDPTDDPALAGARARAYREVAVFGGGTVEIQRRPVGEWETVERREIGPKGGE